MQRALSALRSVFPLVQRALPLLDGNIGAAITAVLAARPHTPATPVDLAPLEDSLTALQTHHQELHERLAEQNTSLKRVEDQLEMVREATDRNTLEQQELLEDLRRIGTRFNGFAFAALALLVASVILNVILYLHIQHVLP